ncbi:MAG: hypothetical protein JW929_11190 [Anaerolineales bacterium]|nr:hypothetical protein [Anaerolineales bacterium]
MFRSALIVGAIAFVYLLVANVAMALCAPFLAILLGFLAGGLAAIYDKPLDAQKAAGTGALAGLIAGIGAVAGNTAGLLIRTFVVFSPETFTQNITDLTGVTYTEAEANLYSLSPVCCCAVTDFILMAGMGALGAYAWFRYKAGKKSAGAGPSGASGFSGGA